MKKIITTLLLVLSVATLNAQNTEKEEGAELTLEVETYDFGKIKKDDKEVRKKFKVKNTGTKPLIVQRVITGCGCARAESPKEPILPNKEAEITLIYETTSVGKFNRRITIFSNTISGKPIHLTITGEIE